VRPVSGAIDDVAADATASAHRHQDFSVTAVATDREQEFDAAWDAVRPAMDGLYLSFESAFTSARLTDAFPPAPWTRRCDSSGTARRLLTRGPAAVIEDGDCAATGRQGTGRPRRTAE